MRRLSVRVSLFLALASWAGPAYPCVAYVEPNFGDVKYADVVVIGRIENYEVLESEHGRSRYARFDVLVHATLFGTAPQRFRMTWNNSTFAEPETMPPGEFLIALRNPSSRAPPLRGPSATIWPAPEGAMTVLQAPCSRAFIFPIDSEEASAVREALAKKAMTGADRMPNAR